ncbi:MAG: glycosyltransferase family 39 protein [Pseudomonadota bacterium]|nr:glycosyltransferase family 39 protein [Pseudomonadota bacterium]
MNTHLLNYKDLKTLLIVLFILLTGFALRSYQASQIEKVPHDDTISYLASAGHLGDYHRLSNDFSSAPAWVTNATWLSFFEARDEPLLSNWHTTIQDLQHLDIHPPLYFLWLNLIMRASPDIEPWTGWLSNTLFYVVNGIMLFMLGRRFISRQAALLGLLIWTVSVATIDTSIIARHYEMVVTISLLSTLVLARTVRRQNLDGLSIVLFGLLTLLGFLTNYQFLYFGLAMSAAILFAHHRQPGRVFYCGLAIASGVCSGIWVYPALLDQTAQVQAWSTEPTASDVLFRLRNTLEELSKFCVLASLLVLFGIWDRGRRAKGQPLPFTLIILAGVSCLLIGAAYMSFFSPRHAMGERYLAVVWPFLALIMGAVVSRYWHYRVYRPVAMVLILLPALLNVAEGDKNQAPPPRMAHASYVIADFNQRGIWPSIALLLPAEQMTLVAPQSTLLQHQQLLTDSAWTAREDGLLISSHALGANQRSGQQQLIELLEPTRDLTNLQDFDRSLDYFEIDLSQAHAENRNKSVIESLSYQAYLSVKIL